MDFDKLIKSRASVRKFSSKKPDWRNIIECIDAARYAPTAGHNSALKFILVDDSESIKKITKACQQDFISSAHYVVVVCSNPSRLVNAYGESGEAYARQQAGAGIQNFLLKIEQVGLSTCWVGYFAEEQIKEVLKIPKDVNVEAVFPIGFEYEKKRTKKAPIDLDRILYFNKYGNTKMQEKESIEV
ncbi:nitroreductase family protein [Candidatus Pacearchaeota archaeon]|nr:nitroreductase family protein [Candidatus Pacearchaeota archaeon]